jgi:hypothetical protein
MAGVKDRKSLEQDDYLDGRTVLLMLTVSPRPIPVVSNLSKANQSVSAYPPAMGLAEV